MGNDPYNYTDPSGEARYKGDKGGVALAYLAAKGVAAVTEPGSALNNYANKVAEVSQTAMTGKMGGKTAVPKKTYQTYTKKNEETGEVYSGKTSGTKDPDTNVANRDRDHHMNDQGYGPAKLDKTSENPDAIRGREQQLIDANGGAKSQGGTSGNAINGVSDKNPKKEHYACQATTEFGGCN